MYIDCDSHYFPVKFLEGVSAKYSHSPRVIRNGDDVRSVLPDGTLIKNQAPKGRWHLDTRDHHVTWEGFDIHVLIPENRERWIHVSSATVYGRKLLPEFCSQDTFSEYDYRSEPN